jgi:hypothetical protein
VFSLKNLLQNNVILRKSNNFSCLKIRINTFLETEVQDRKPGITEISYKDGFMNLKLGLMICRSCKTCFDNLVNIFMVAVIDGSLMIPNMLLKGNIFCAAIIELLEIQR